MSYMKKDIKEILKRRNKIEIQQNIFNLKVKCLISHNKEILRFNFRYNFYYNDLNNLYKWNWIYIHICIYKYIKG